MYKTFSWLQGRLMITCHIFSFVYISSARVYAQTWWWANCPVGGVDAEEGGYSIYTKDSKLLNLKFLILILCSPANVGLEAKQTECLCTALSKSITGSYCLSLADSHRTHTDTSFQSITLSTMTSHPRVNGCHPIFGCLPLSPFILSSLIGGNKSLPKLRGCGWCWLNNRTPENVNPTNLN